MQRTIELLYDTLGIKRDQLLTAREKREDHIKHLCSQQKAISSLECDIERLEADLKNLHSMNTPSKMMAESNGCALSPDVSELKQRG